MAVSVYSVNSFLKADTTLQTIAGKTMNFFPILGFGDEDPPFVVYYFSPNIPSVESFWNRYDSVRYVIYDVDVDRLYDIAERMIYLLGRGDTVGSNGGITSNNFRFKSSMLTDAGSIEPIEKEGWYQLDLDFTIYSVSA